MYVEQMSQSTMEIVKTLSLSLRPASQNDSTSHQSHHLIFFITGNPGLISYYNTFLGTLYELLASKFNTVSDQLHIYGQSMAGFEDSDDLAARSPYSLEEQIKILRRSLENIRILSGPRKGQSFDNIILIGHSVGSYVVLELIQRLRKSSSPLNIKAGILLFPTITHISQSPSGVKITTLFRIPDFPRKASLAAKSLVWLAPKAVLRWLVGLVTGMSQDAAEVTMRFLKSRIGIWQALHMAKDEMETITEDKWDEDIWGIERGDLDQKQKTPKLIFYFGQNDHWVADHTRDALIAARGQIGENSSGSRPTMIIDQDGVPHGFCLKHSEIIAEKVNGWITDILEEA